jgi:hypothetical protein
VYSEAELAEINQIYTLLSCHVDLLERYSRPKKKGASQYIISLEVKDIIRNKVSFNLLKFSKMFNF